MAEESTNGQDLILQRYRKIKMLKKTNRKQIWYLESINSGQKCIMKCQSHNSIQNSSQRTVLHEANFLNAMQGHVGFPFMIWSGQENDSYLILVEQLGRPLNQIYDVVCKKNFSVKTVCMIGLQVLKIIQDYHSIGFVHRRIIPQTFQLGKTHKNHLIFLNDLFDSKKYASQRTNKHLEPNKFSKLSSHLSAFTTLNQIQQGQSSRRDDVEAVILILIYFLRGNLPWQYIINRKIDNIEKMEALRIAISKTSVSNLCEGMPAQFGIMLQKARSLSFTAEPSYHWFIQQIERVMFRNHYENDFYFDWIKIESENKMSYLRVNKTIPTIHLPNQDAILQRLYFPFEDKIQIDVVSEKHKNRVTKQEEQKLMDELYEEKGSKKNKNDKKNRKSDCEIM